MLLQDYDIALPMADVFDQSGSADSLADATDAVYVGDVFFGTQRAHHLAFRRYEGDWELWISTEKETPVPLMITGSSPYEHGWPKFQAVFVDWDFAADVPAERFQFVAPDGFEEIELMPAKEVAQ